MYPEDALGLALEGAWHLGVIRKVGEKIQEIGLVLRLAKVFIFTIWQWHFLQIIH